MSGQSHYPNSYGKPMFPANEHQWQENVYDEVDRTLVNDSIAYPSQTSYTGWNNPMEMNRFQQPLHRDGALSHPLSSSSTGLRSSDAFGDPQSWSCGTSSQQTVFYQDAMPFDSSSSTTGSSQYYYPDASSSLSLNDLPNNFNEFHPPTHTASLGMNLQPPSLPPAPRQQSPHPARTFHSSGFQRSREPSPAHSDSDPKRRFPCMVSGCGRRFTSQYTLKVHMETHKPKPRVSFECTLGCSERFSRQHDRLRHEVAKHGKVCEFRCDDCGRFFSTSKTLGNHKCPVAQGSTRWVNNTS